MSAVDRRAGLFVRGRVRAAGRPAPPGGETGSRDNPWRAYEREATRSYTRAIAAVLLVMGLAAVGAALAFLQLWADSR